MNPYGIFEGPGATRFSLGTKLVKRLRYRQYNSWIIEKTMGLTLGPSAALCEIFVSIALWLTRRLGLYDGPCQKPPHTRSRALSPLIVIRESQWCVLIIREEFRLTIKGDKARDLVCGALGKACYIVYIAIWPYLTIDRLSTVCFCECQWIFLIFYQLPLKSVQ